MTKKAQRRKCRCAFFRGYKRNSRLFLRGLVKPHVHGDEPQRDCQKPETCNCQIVKCAVTEEQRHQQCGTQRKENRLHEALHGSGQTSGLRQEVHGNQGHARTNDTDADGVDHQGQNSPDDAFGQQALLEPGVPGKMKVTRKTTLKDGLFQTHIISKTVLEEPRRELVERGMARSIETSRGRMRYNKVMTMEITAYTLGEGSGTGRTSIGLVPYEGIVAVDPRVIPYYTKLYIPGYGIAMAGDTGGAIRGNRLDVFMHDWHRAIQWGRRTLDVYILE